MPAAKHATAPLPQDGDMPALRGQGVAVLIAYWAGLLPPKVRPDGVASYPGLDCSGFGDVTVRAVGYTTPQEAKGALDEAASVCHDGGLVLSPIEGAPPHHGFVVRRRT